MEKLDRRVQRTQQLLGDALIALIFEKGYEAITIKDVVERADVAYVTFFRHYRDLDELLTQRLEQGIKELMSRIDQAMQGAPGAIFRDGEGRLIFQHVRENASLYRILLNSRGAAHLRKRVQETIAASILAQCPPLYENPGGIPAEIAANHIAAAQLALIEWWLDREMPYPIERMARIASQLISRATEHALGITSPVPEQPPVA